MGERKSYEPGTFCWVDLATTDPEGAKAFYGELFGWDAEDMPVDETMTYTMVSLDGDYVCGIYAMPPDQRGQGTAPNWLSHVSVESADDTAETASELGGEIMAEPFDVFDSGRMALIMDPLGAVLSIWQPQEHIGAGRVNDVGCLGWNELNTREPEKASGFYSGLFGWRMEEMKESGELVYAVIKNGERSNGGIMPVADQRGDSPSYWLPYFIVRSCDVSAARVRELGGTVLVEPFEPGEGRISILGDPQGAVFAIFEGETEG